MGEKFDVVVVGAGPGGCAAALTLAKDGYDVLLLEKSKLAGHRNMTGGVLFGKYIEGYGMVDLIPGFEQEAPLERRIMEHKVYIMSDPKSGDGKSKYKFYELTKGSILSKLGIAGLDIVTGHDYSILRAKFDRWFASKVAEAGGMVATEKSVEDVIREDSKIVGVRTVDEEIYADMVIDASGITSSLIEKVGLRNKLLPDQVYYGIKHVYKLDEGSINELFNLESGEGKALFFFGEFMRGINGGAFLYTNKDTLSVGIVVSLDSLIDKCTRHPDQIGKPLELLELFESHPMISNYIEGAKLVEYSGHNIPKGPKCMLKKPYAEGFLAVGDSLGCFVKIGALIDGMRRAIASGIMAAETYKLAKKKRDFSEKTLSYYKELLKPIYSDVRRSRFNGYITETKLAYSILPKVIFKVGIGLKKGEAKSSTHHVNNRDMIQKIQERTGILDYEEDKDYSHIKVNYDLANRSPYKAWIPACPFNCYTLVLDKGVFASFKDLYEYNLNLVKKQKGCDEKTCRKEALWITLNDIRRGQVRFDHVACVGCGTCGVIGPPEIISFGHERYGHGVKYKYG